MPKFRVDYKFVCEGAIVVEAENRDEAEATMRLDYERLWREGYVADEDLDCTQITEAHELPLQEGGLT